MGHAAVRDHVTTSKGAIQAETMPHIGTPHPTQSAFEPDEQVGRFDEGQELEPEKDREQVGRFDEGQELEPEKDREHVGRFDDQLTQA
jgi:hypothetical protein